jgi:glycerol kinase
VAELVAAIDQGTTSSRCVLFDGAAQPVAMHQLPHRQILPRPGLVEHDPVEISKNVDACVRGALAAAGAGPGDLAAVGVSNQRETAILWERASGRPVANAIVWQDTRTDAICRELAADGGIWRLQERTGLPLSTYSSGPKITWLLDADPALRAAAERGELAFGTADSWVVWNLTGGPDGGLHLTDVSNASRTLLMDLERRSWDDELCELLRVPRALLPEIRSSSEVYGAAGGALAGVPIAGILGDQQAALLGHVCVAPGEAKCTYGTGCFLLLATGERPPLSRHGLIATVASQLGAAGPVRYALEGSVAVAGSLVQWLCEELGIAASGAEVERLAQDVEDSAGVVVVPAFSGLFAPRWRADARGLIGGLTRHSDRRHLARAALEATAFQVLEIVEAMEADAALASGELHVDGGMTANRLLMQLQADLLGRPVAVPQEAEMTALGAAFAAGLAVGAFAGLDALRGLNPVARRFEPRIGADEREHRVERWRLAVERSLDWA